MSIDLYCYETLSPAPDLLEEVPLGSGAFGTVYRRNNMAVKIIKNSLFPLR
jgi:hypothetical protein